MKGFTLLPSPNAISPSGSVHDKLEIRIRIQCSRFDGDCDNDAAGKIRREAHRPMELIGGFMRSH